MRKLHLQFRNADGSRKTMIIQHCHQNLSPEAVRQAMEEIIALGIFERNGVKLYTEIIGAKYVETKVTWIFERFSSRRTPSGEVNTPDNNLMPANHAKTSPKTSGVKEDSQIDINKHSLFKLSDREIMIAEKTIMLLLISCGFLWERVAKLSFIGYASDSRISSFDLGP